MGRKILHQFLIINKAIESYRNHKLEEVIFKIYFGKTYNHVGWGSYKVSWKRVLGLNWHLGFKV